ncbi:MAG: hypothetical protein GY801_32875 [bacterium]|nr:hypothetical protein [bacterium]
MHGRTNLCTRSRWLLVGIVCIIAGSFPIRSSAQTVLKLLAKPALEEDTLYIPSDLRDGIKIYAEITGKWKQLTWKFSGPGRFQNTEFGAVYLPPEALKEPTAYVHLSATLITSKGQLIRESLKWTLMGYPPTPTPSPTPTATPTPTPTITPTPTSTPTPSPSPSVTVTPTPSPSPGVTATSILSAAPDPSATVTVSPVSPSPDLTVISTVTPSPRPDPTPTVTPRPKPDPIPTVTPSPSPDPTATPTVTPSSIPDLTATPIVTPKVDTDTEATSVPALSKPEEHLRAAKIYFNKKWYTTPKGENAFDEYKMVLKLDPTNHEAERGIYNILQKYKFWADDEDKKGRLVKARKAYGRYLMVADYLLETFDDPKLEQDVQEIKKRLQ